MEQRKKISKQNDQLGVSGQHCCLWELKEEVVLKNLWCLAPLVVHAGPFYFTILFFSCPRGSYVLLEIEEMRR